MPCDIVKESGKYIFVLWDFANIILFQDRQDRRVSQKKYARELTSIFESKFDLPKVIFRIFSLMMISWYIDSIQGSLPIVFIDSHYNRYRQSKS